MVCCSSAARSWPLANDQQGKLGKSACRSSMARIRISLSLLLMEPSKIAQGEFPLQPKLSTQALHLVRAEVERISRGQNRKARGRPWWDQFLAGASGSHE